MTYCKYYSNVDRIRPNIGYKPAHNVAIRKSLNTGTKYH